MSTRDEIAESFDRIRDAAVRAFAVSRMSAKRDPIGRVKSEREFDALFEVIETEKRKQTKGRDK
jgi:hypothetical protein